MRSDLLRVSWTARLMSNPDLICQIFFNPLCANARWRGVEACRLEI